MQDALRGVLLLSMIPRDVVVFSRIKKREQPWAGGRVSTNSSAGAANASRQAACTN